MIRQGVSMDYFFFFLMTLNMNMSKNKSVGGGMVRLQIETVKVDEF